MKIFFSIILIVFAGGCSLSPDYKTPAVNVPQGWSESAIPGETQIDADWWKGFGSDELDKLMEQALSANTDLRAAVHRVEQARASLKIVGASLLPSAEGSGSLSWDRDNPDSGKTISKSSGGASVGISYELDLFGANKAAKEAASAVYEGSRFDHDALALVVMSDVARTYFTDVSLRERLKIAQDNLKNAGDVLAIVQARVDAGAAAALDVAQQKVTVANGRVALSTLEEQELNTRNALAVLLGQTSQDVKIKAQSLKEIDIPAIAPGQPSQLLERRPDIRSAEAALFVSNADIGAARAALFPVVTLGLDWSVAASPVSAPTATALSLASTLTAPIFQGGRLEGGIEKATARQAELAENYRKTVLVSFQEVEDALVAVKETTFRQKALKTAMDESQQAFDLSFQQYKAGAIDFQTLLDSQRSLFSAEDSFSQENLAMLSTAVDLFKALGGGWKR